MPKRIAIYTSDEKIRNLSIRKEEVNTQLLTVLKETAVDCRANQPDNEPLDCFTVAVTGTPYMFDPDLERDKTSTQAIKEKKKATATTAATATTGTTGTTVTTVGVAATATATAATKARATVTAVKIRLDREGRSTEYLLGARDPSRNYVEFYESNDTGLSRPVGQIRLDVDDPNAAQNLIFY